MKELSQVLPSEIEARSFEIITEELGERTFPEKEAPIVKRVIHTTADFEYADSLVFSPGAVDKALEALKNGACIVTDTNMGKSGINKRALASLGGEVYCFMADEDVAKKAAASGTTRAVASMDKAAEMGKDCIFAVGNPPEAHHRRAGRLCQCRAVQGIDYILAGHSLYCGKRQKGRQQCSRRDLQCIDLSVDAQIRCDGVKSAVLKCTWMHSQKIYWIWADVYQQPKPPPPQQQHRSRIQIRQSQLLPPHPWSKHPPPHPPQHSRIRIRKRQLLLPKPPHPQPQLQPQLPPLLSHPQPQLVAAKSLMVMSSEIFYTLHHMRGSLPQFP